jgi:hypothetical protein
MRAAAVIVLGVIGLAACGGSSPPPAKSEADTSSLEGSSSSKEKDTSDDSSGSSASSSSPSAPSSATPAPAPASAPAASAAPAADSSAPAAAFHPAPSVTGTIDGKAFTPKVAQVLSPMKKDGRIQLTLTEASDCPSGGDKGDHATLTMLVPWSDGYKVDLASLKLGGKKGPGEIALSHGKSVSATFKPSGTVTVVSAPMDKTSTGKLKVDLQSGDYMLAGTLDIEMCAAPK